MFDLLELHQIRLGNLEETQTIGFGQDTREISLFLEFMLERQQTCRLFGRKYSIQTSSLLPISFKNRKEGDFTMVYGFPGRTEQHVVSSYLKFIVEKERPSRIRMRDLSLDVINTEMKNSELVKIQYASKQARISNAWKKMDWTN